MLINYIYCQNIYYIIKIIRQSMNNSKGYDNLRGYNPAQVQSQVYQFTKIAQKQRTQLFKNNPHWTGKQTDPFMNKTKQNNRCEKWYDPNYRPIMKRNNIPNTNPIVPTNKQQKAKVQKYFNDPAQFKGSVKRTVFSERNSNIFHENQSQAEWKTSVKPIILKQSKNMQQNQKPQIKQTEYTIKYKRNPITNEMSEINAKNEKRCFAKQRNPITEGETKDFMQKKGRVSVQQEIVKLA